MRTGETSVPNADSTLALTGNTTRSESSSSATPQACTGPAPPNASTATPRRSTPCSTACIRAAAAMFWLTISYTPAAACDGVEAESIADRVATAVSAAVPSRGMSPPKKAAGSSKPSTTSASVTAGCVPPRPYDAGPGSAPDDSGPTLSNPNWSVWAIDPPPAPISTRSIDGTDTGNPEPFLNR